MRVIRLPDPIAKIAEVAADSEQLTIEQWVAGLIVRNPPEQTVRTMSPLTRSELPVLDRYPVGYED